MAERKSFSPDTSGEKGQGGSIGPRSNTGQKGQEGQNAIIDYLTFVVPYEVLEERRLTNLDNLLNTVFGFHGAVFATAIRDKRWQFHPACGARVRARRTDGPARGDGLARKMLWWIHAAVFHAAILAERWGPRGLRLERAQVVNRCHAHPIQDFA